MHDRQAGADAEWSAPAYLAPATPGPWVDKLLAPPPDLAIPVSPPGGRARAAREAGTQVVGELERRRSRHCIVHDGHVPARTGGFAGSALLPRRLSEVRS